MTDIQHLEAFVDLINLINIVIEALPVTNDISFASKIIKYDVHRGVRKPVQSVFKDNGPKQCCLFVVRLLNGICDLEFEITESKPNFTRIPVVSKRTN